ncbi:hypothetical protein OC842_000184 [Tilletia horrida]|uniref:Uncharacterized protein n=1 Tax=Tilletia horrida TaxID=155126 RepID=A0AAN6GHG0_9BASI|nr:hypothetical protein OC842_000184 [Tilletia horrida]
MSNPTAMDNMLTCHFSGIIQIDEVKKETSKSYHHIDGQTPMKSDQDLIFKGTGFNLGHQQLPAVYHGAGSFCGAGSQAKLTLSSHSHVFDGAVPVNFINTGLYLHGTGRVTGTNVAEAWVRYVTYAYNRETGLREMVEILALRLPDTRWKNVPMPTIGAYAHFIGTLNHQQTVNNTFVIHLDDCAWSTLPVSPTVSTTNNTSGPPRKKPALGSRSRRSDGGGGAGPSSASGSGTQSTP